MVLKPNSDCVQLNVKTKGTLNHWQQ